MNVSAVSTNAVSQAFAVSARQAPPPAKDNDGDNDQGAPETKAATPPGVGENLDLKV